MFYSVQRFILSSLVQLLTTQPFANCLSWGDPFNLTALSSYVGSYSIVIGDLLISLLSVGHCYQGAAGGLFRQQACPENYQSYKMSRNEWWLWDLESKWHWKGFHIQNGHYLIKNETIFGFFSNAFLWLFYEGLSFTQIDDTQGTTYQSITFRFKENFLQHVRAFKLNYLSAALDGTSPLVLQHNEYIFRINVF